MNLIQTLEAEQIAKFAQSKQLPEFRPGDTLRVGVKVVEGERTRVQAYEGVCIARSNKGMGSNFTVRKISFGEGRRAGVPAVFAEHRQHRSCAQGRRPPRQAVLSAWSYRQVGPHRRASRHAAGQG